MTSSSEAGQRASRVRVLTWNVWWRFGPGWRQRQPLLLRHLRAAKADVVALQECWGTCTTSQAHELAAELGMYAAFVSPSLPPPPQPPEHPEQAGVEVGIGLVSRWPLATVRKVAMPSRRIPAPVATAAVVGHPAGPLHLVTACLEWEPAYDDDRAAQARAVLDLTMEQAADGPLPVILCGDLNAAPHSPVLRPLHDSLADAWEVGEGDPQARTLPSDHPQAPVEAAELIDQRIDHVFFRPGRPGMQVAVDHVALVGHPVDGLYPSDHLGVVCDLSWS